MGKAGLQARIGFMVGEAHARPLVGGAGSWPSGGLFESRGCVQR